MLDSEVYIRRVSLEWAIKLQEIAISTFEESFAKDNSRENMEKYLLKNFNIRKLKAELENPESWFFYAVTDQGIVGYLKVNSGAAQTDFKLEDALEIERIYVLADFQGRKIGKMLYEKAVEVAKLEDCKRIWLGVWEHNLKAIGFYKMLGFEEFEKHDFLLGNDEQTDILMKKELD